MPVIKSVLIPDSIYKSLFNFHPVLRESCWLSCVEESFLRLGQVLKYYSEEGCF